MSPKEMVAMLLSEDEPQIDPAAPDEDLVSFAKRRRASKHAAAKSKIKLPAR